MWTALNRSGVVIVILLAAVLMAVAGCVGENGEGQAVDADPIVDTPESSGVSTEPSPNPAAISDTPTPSSNPATGAPTIPASIATNAPIPAPTPETDSPIPAPTATMAPIPTPTAAPAPSLMGISGSNRRRMRWTSWA